MKKSLKLLAYAVVILVLAGVIYVAFRPAPIAVEIGTIQAGPMQVTVDEQGETRSHDRFVVAAPVSGRLLRVLHHDGDAVSRNDVVATLAPTPLTPAADEFLQGPSGVVLPALLERLAATRAVRR